MAGRAAWIIGIPHGTQAREIVVNSDVPVAQVHKEMSAFRARRSHEKYAEVQLWETDSMPTPRHEMLTPAEWDRRQVDQKKSQADHAKFLKAQSSKPGSNPGKAASPEPITKSQKTSNDK